MDIKTLKSILDKFPDDYEVKYQENNISDVIEIDVENEVVILK